jgi:hypothetical protein
MLDLEPPQAPAVRRAPDPEPLFHHPASAFRVHIGLRAPDTVTVDRRPASVQQPRDGWHLVVGEGASDLRLTEKASVLYREPATAPDAAQGWARSTLAAFPGARLAVCGVPDGAVVLTRDGRFARVVSTADVSVLGSVAYHLLLSGSFVTRELVAEIGTLRVPVRFEVSPAPPTAG